MEPRLPNLSLLPAGYEVSRQETRTLMRWLLTLDSEDPRYALARLLSQPEITGTFKYVIIDTPPRLNWATVNALCASQFLIIPTIFDLLSIENVGGLLNQTDKWFRRDLNPHLRLAGIIGSMTKQRDLNETELRARRTVEERARENWDKMDPTVVARLDLEPWPEDAHVFLPHVPDTARFLQDAGRDIAYLDERKENRDTRAILDKLGQAILKRIHS
jgi:cellulose biosynthesis protein BcsQ